MGRVMVPDPRKFPQYASHVEAALAGCFECHVPLDPNRAIDAHYPKGRGQYGLYCQSCRLITFYDLKVVKK